jgi:PqqD family protein of HPr-rel-A system
MTQATDNPRWHIAPAGQLLSAEFDGQTVVYHTGAGHTHWVSPVAAEVLHQLEHGPRDERALYKALSELVEDSDIPMLADSLRETLDHLKSLTLIEPA